jgi:hypothetical protein
MLRTFFLASFLAASTAFGAEPTASVSAESSNIPLKEIWALEMPGTIDYRILDPDSFGRVPRDASVEVRRSISEKYMNSMGRKIKLAFMEQARPDTLPIEAFAVEGTGKEALSNLFRVVVEGKEEQNVFSKGGTLSLVFYARLSPYYVHLDQVQRDGNSINISYRLVPHMQRNATAHFALIPLTKIEPGEVDVNILPPIFDDKFDQLNVSPPQENDLTKFVSRSFSFEVSASPLKGTRDDSDKMSNGSGSDDPTPE